MISAYASVFIYTSGPLLSSLYMQLPICNDSVDFLNVAEQVMAEICMLFCCPCQVFNEHDQRNEI